MFGSKKTFPVNLEHTPALQIRAAQQSITANPWPLTALFYQIMIIVTNGFSKKTFFIIISRSSCMQMFFKICVIRNFAIFIEKHLCWSLFLIKLKAGLQLYFNFVAKETWTQEIPVKIAKFLQVFYMEYFRWLLLSVWCNCSVMGICRSSLLNQKQNMWAFFLLKSFVNLVRVCYLHIISKNHSNSLSLTSLLETKVKQSKALQQRLFVDSVDWFLSITQCSLSNSRQHSTNADVIADMKSKIIVSRQHFFADMISFFHFKSSKLSK